MFRLSFSGVLLFRSGALYVCFVCGVCLKRYKRRFRAFWRASVCRAFRRADFALYSLLRAFRRVDAEVLSCCVAAVIVLESFVEPFGVPNSRA